MATFRVGVGSFNINDGSVGIGTEGSGHGNLKVEGTIKSTKNLDVLGVSTFTRYSGFNADEVNVNNRDLTLSGEYSTTGDIVVEDGASLIMGLGSTACVGSVECISVKHHFSVPVGDTAQRNETSGYAEGTVRYNRDLGTMEFFNGSEWRQFTYIADIQNSPSSRGRAVFNGVNPNASMYSVEIMSQGIAADFGDTSSNHDIAASFSSSTRGIIGGGYAHPADITAIEYVTIASAGNAISFGSLATSHFRNSGGCSSSTRGLFFAGGHPSYYNTIEYVEINTLGNALDFGDQSTTFAWRRCFASATRGFSAGGFDGPAAPNITTDMVTIASKGNGTKFGELSTKVFGMGAFANSVKGVYGGGYTPGYAHIVDDIQFFTMASEGNAINFGDLTVANGSPAGASNQVRGIFAGGYLSPGNNSDRAQFITIASTGSAQDFGDMTISFNRADGLSDSHGGLGGY